MDQRFCQGYFHVDRWYERKQPTLCLHDEERCPRHGVRGLVRLAQDEDTLFLREFANVSRGGTEANLHVEDLMTTDAELHEALRARPGRKVVTLFITYQPCHHSGGHRQLATLHRKSCSEKVRAWARDTLAPCDARLRIKCFNLYRVHWVDAAIFHDADDERLFGARAGLALEGLLGLLREPNIGVDVMAPEDWPVFLRLLARGSDLLVPAVSDEDWATRRKYEASCQAYLDTLKASLEWPAAAPARGTKRRLQSVIVVLNEKRACLLSTDPLKEDLVLRRTHANAAG
jgi:hypothetical protein